MKKLTIIGIVFFGILFTGFMGFAQDFQSSDLEGTWQLYMFETDPVAGSSYYAHGSFTADESGNVTSGTYIPPVGPAINVAGGTLSLVRYETIAEGADKCDFRFQKGRKTFVYPLRDGWPPQFHDSSTDM